MAGREKHAQRSRYSYHKNRSAMNGWQNAQSRKAYDRAKVDHMKRRGIFGFANALKAGVDKLSSAYVNNNREGETNNAFDQKGAKND